MKSLGTACAACGADDVRWKGVKRYHYTESGLDGIWLVDGVQRATCSACGEKWIHVEAEWQLLQVIAIVLLRKRGLLSGPETRFLRETAHLTQEELAALLGLRGQPTVSERERRRGSVMTYAEDLGFRFLILKHFSSFLRENPREDFLTAVHWRVLAKLAMWLCDKADQLTGRRKTVDKLELQRSDSKWTADILKEAA